MLATNQTNTQVSSYQLSSFLHQIAGIITSNRFLRFLKGTESRFDLKCSGLHEKLYEDFLFQCHQSCSIRTKGSELSFIFANIASILGKVADRTHECVLKKDRKLSIPNGSQTFLTAISDLMDMNTLEASLRSLNEHHRYGDSLSFYVSNFISELTRYCTARHILAFDSGLSKYESMLKVLFKEPSWFVNGHPYDVLVHDLNSIKFRNATTIRVQKEFCSSVALSKEDLLNHTKTNNSHLYFSV